jgi:NAD(P)-dependent dehydrogenase (short-subunit alcohol dehydrogenase family)
MDSSIQFYIKDKSFEGKNIIVTGGTGGIGSRIAESFIKCGAKVVVVSKTEKKVLSKYGIILIT